MKDKPVLMKSANALILPDAANDITQSFEARDISESHLEQANEINHYHVHLPPEPPKPGFVITTDTRTDTSVSENYVDRKKFDSLRKLAEDGSPKILVCGMGGSGKTELCKKLYSVYLTGHKEKAQIPFDHIGFMKYQGTLDDTLVGAVGLQRSGNHAKDVQAAWQMLKRIADSSRLLLIIDDIGSTQKDDSISHLMALSCTIVLTARYTACDSFTPFPVGMMELGECKKLFERTYRKIKKESEWEDFKTLIEERACRHAMTVKLFASIAKSHSWTVRKLKENAEHSRFHISYLEDGKEKSLIREYAKLFKLSGLSAPEKNILEAFSVLPYRMLPIDICAKWMGADAKAGDAALAITGLHQKGWLEQTDAQLAMHPVISEVVRHIQKPNWRKHKQLILACAQSVDINITEICTQKIPHWVFAESIISALYHPRSQEVAILCHNTARVFRDVADYDKAMIYLQKELYINENLKGKMHADTANSYNNIAYIYYLQRKYGKSLECFFKSLAIKEKVLKKEHLEIAISFNNIANIYCEQKKYDEALEWFNKSLKIKEKVLDNNDPSIAVTYNNIANVFYNQKENNKALEYYFKSLTINENVLGKEHPYTAITYNNIASVYKTQGECEKALEWHHKALVIREKVQGKIHPDTAASYNNIAGIHYSYGEYEKALEWYVKSFRVYVIRQMLNHPNAENIFSNMFSAYFSSGRKEEDLKAWLKARFSKEV